jgi:hypothetical protein
MQGAPVILRLVTTGGRALNLIKCSAKPHFYGTVYEVSLHSTGNKKKKKKKKKSPFVFLSFFVNNLLRKPGTKDGYVSISPLLIY